MITISVEDDPSCWARVFFDIDEDGRARVRLVEKHIPDGYGLDAFERELLDGLAGIIARAILRHRGDR